MAEFRLPFATTIGLLYWRGVMVSIDILYEDIAIFSKNVFWYLTKDGAPRGNDTCSSGMLIQLTACTY